MINEADISRERDWFNECRARAVVNNLQKRNIDALYVSGRQQALATVLEMIPPGAVVTRGDSVTLEQVGIISALKERNQNTFIDPFERDAEGSFTAKPEQRDQMHREGFFADIFLSGTNAITLDGKLVNIDGYGSRVAKMIFGPKKVIIVVGTNKIVRDVNEAIARIHEVAAPLNAERHHLKHKGLGDLPCVKTGKCVDCSPDRRMCRYTTIIEGTSLAHKGRINVVLVGEELGF